MLVEEEIVFAGRRWPFDEDALRLGRHRQICPETMTIVTKVPAYLEVQGMVARQTRLLSAQH